MTVTRSTDSSPVTTATDLDPATVEGYRRNGFVRIPSVLTPYEVAIYRDAAARAYERMGSLTSSDVFKQIIQLWRRDDVLRNLTLHAGLAAIASRLAGIDLRLWHDHLLIKKPHNGVATEFHQDAPYWPHATSRHCLSAWIALVDVPVERGCMTSSQAPRNVTTSARSTSRTRPTCSAPRPTSRTNSGSRCRCAPGIARSTTGISHTRQPERDRRLPLRPRGDLHRCADDLRRQAARGHGPVGSDSGPGSSRRDVPAAAGLSVPASSRR